MTQARKNIMYNSRTSMNTSQYSLTRLISRKVDMNLRINSIMHLVHVFIYITNIINKVDL